jgi:hypothetical protein
MRAQPVRRDDSVMSDSENDWLLREGMMRQSALGEIVLESAYLERLLRCVFTALVGSKYAAVVSGGKEASWLVDHCKALAKTHQDIGEPRFEQLLAVLAQVADGFRRRNRVMHDAHAVRPGQQVVTLQSKRNSHEVVVTRRPVAEIHALADEMGCLADDLKAAAGAALGEDCLRLENVLRLELGHDIATDIG